MLRALPLVFMLLLAPTMTLAHAGHDEAGHFLAGLAHPLVGADHLLAMVAVGLWAVLAGGRAVVAYPLAFMAAMLAGGLAGAGGIVLPAVEPAILVSVVVLGGAAALALRAPAGMALGLLGIAGLAHGLAHGAEGPGGAAYAAGFLLATGALHLAGIGFARLGTGAARVAGSVVALAGAVLAVV